MDRAVMLYTTFPSLVEAENAGKLKALRAAARVGATALDRGAFKEFESIEELQSYLIDLSEQVISRTSE